MSERRTAQGAHEWAIATLDDLQARLRRLEYYLSGSDDAQLRLEAAVSQGKDHTVMARLSTLQHTLHNLSERSPVVHDLLQIRQSSKPYLGNPEVKLIVSFSPSEHAYPTLFQPIKSELDINPSKLSTEEIRAIVAAHSPLYHQTASQLTSIHDLAIPSSSLSTSLISLQPRIAKIQSLQEAQAKEMAALRARSAKAVQRWYELGVLGQGECWAEWEGRMEECEKKVRRVEGGRKRVMKEQEMYMT